MFKKVHPVDMVKTEKYKEAVISITTFCKHINRDIGSYRSHFLSSDCTFIVDLSNGTLKIPLHVAGEFNKENIRLITEQLKQVAASFLPVQIESRSYKKIMADWRNLFLEKGKK